MRIAFIGQKGLPAKTDGIEKYVEEIALRMAEKGHEVFVYVQDGYASKNLKEYKGINLVHIPQLEMIFFKKITHAWLASVHAIFSKYDVVHYHSGAQKFAWITKFFKWRTLAITSAIPVGTNVKYSEEVSEISAWNLKDKKYLLYVGRLTPKRGINFLIDAFKQLEDTGKTTMNFKLVIVGDEYRDPMYVKSLKEMSQGRENIVLTGLQTGEALQQLFSHAYLFVQPNETQESSIALLEAMMYGLAPVVSNTKENIEYVKEDGFYFESANVGELRDKLAYLLTKNELVAEYGKLAKDLVNKNYSWDSAANKTLEAYEQKIKALKGKHALKSKKAI